MALELTREQERILEHDPRRHARVLAGPGTGKSTTMVALLRRIHHRHRNLRAKMLTFTRAATAELAAKLPPEVRETQRPSTIHSFAISVLLMNPGAGGFPEPLRVADTWEMMKLVKPTLAARIGVPLGGLQKLLAEMAANWESLSPEVDKQIDDALRRRFQAAWAEHRAFLGYTLLEELPYALLGALESHRRLDAIDYDVLLVDEYQDLNACDLKVVKLLSEKSGTAIIGTGDDDQSVYSFRKAAPEGIRRFALDYAGAADYPLSLSLRCGRRIVDWATHVIARDPSRPRDRGVLGCPDGAVDGEVALLEFPGDRSEAKGVARIAKGLIEREHVAPCDILVLTRTDYRQAFSRPLKQALESVGVACWEPDFVLRLLEERANRTLLEVMRLLVHRHDSLAWAGILEVTAGVGGSFFDYICARAREHERTFADELLSAKGEGFPGAPRVSSSIAGTLVERVTAWLEAHPVPPDPPPTGWGHWIVGVADGLVAPRPTPQFEDMLLQLDTVCDVRDSLGRFLAQVEPLGKDLALARSDRVRIMTMTGSKGLTVRAAVLVGVEDGLVPRPGEDPSEERRILYVAMTRAREYVYCTYAGRRRGPTARAGRANAGRRRPSQYLDGGPVHSQAGDIFATKRFGK